MFVKKKEKKRKRTEAEVSEGQNSAVREEPPKKVKKTRKKELSKAEEKLASRCVGGAFLKRD